MMPHLEEKMLWMTKRINERSVLENKTKNNLDIYEKTVIPAALYGCEAWNLTCQEENVNRGPPSTDIENIMKIPKSSPTTALLVESGCLRMKNMIHKRQLNYNTVNEFIKSVE